MSTKINPSKLTADMIERASRQKTINLWIIVLTTLGVILFVGLSFKSSSSTVKEVSEELLVAESKHKEVEEEKIAMENAYKGQITEYQIQVDDLQTRYQDLESTIGQNDSYLARRISQLEAQNRSLAQSNEETKTHLSRLKTTIENDLSKLSNTVEEDAEIAPVTKRKITTEIDQIKRKTILNSRSLRLNEGIRRINRQ